MNESYREILRCSAIRMPQLLFPWLINVVDN